MISDDADDVELDGSVPVAALDVPNPGDANPPVAVGCGEPPVVVVVRVDATPASVAAEEIPVSPGTGEAPAAPIGTFVTTGNGVGTFSVSGTGVAMLTVAGCGVAMVVLVGTLLAIASGIGGGVTFANRPGGGGVGAAPEAVLAFVGEVLLDDVLVVPLAAEEVPTLDLPPARLGMPAAVPALPVAAAVLDVVPTVVASTWIGKFATSWGVKRSPRMSSVVSRPGP